MSLTRNDIIENISSIGFTKKKSEEIFDAIVELMMTTLISGDDLLISGFGKFCVKEKDERLGRNPYTGENLMLEGTKVVTFKCSGKLRDKVKRN